MKDKHLIQRVMSNILPSHSLKYIFFAFFLICFSPFAIYGVFPNIILNTQLLVPLLFTYGLFFTIFSLLIGFVLVGLKNPFTQYWKDKFFL